MRYLAWFFRIVVFLLLFGFAIKNTDTATLRYFYGYEWQAPLVLILLVFFGAGVAVGMAACAGAIFRQRREISGLKRELRATGKTSQGISPDRLT